MPSRGKGTARRRPQCQWWEPGPELVWVAPRGPEPGQMRDGAGYLLLSLASYPGTRGGGGWLW